MDVEIMISCYGALSRANTEAEMDFSWWWLRFPLFWQGSWSRSPVLEHTLTIFTCPQECKKTAESFCWFCSYRKIIGCTLRVWMPLRYGSNTSRWSSLPCFFFLIFTICVFWWKPDTFLNSYRYNNEPQETERTGTAEGTLDALSKISALILMRCHLTLERYNT